MNVTIKQKCSRCKRENPFDVESTQVTNFEAQEQDRENAVKQLCDDLKQRKVDVMPDLMVYYKGETYTLTRVCNEFCDKTVRNQIALMFREMDATQRASRKTRKPSEVTTETEKSEETVVQGVATDPTAKLHK